MWRAFPWREPVPTSLESALTATAQRRFSVLNRSGRFNPADGEAEVKYLDGDFRVIRPGAFVRCVVTGTSIPLEELKYWDVDRQEAYVSPEAVMQRRRVPGG